jgi:hypothetical protein
MSLISAWAKGELDGQRLELAAAGRKNIFTDARKGKHALNLLTAVQRQGLLSNSVALWDALF